MNNNNVEMSDFDKLSMHNENYKNVATIIRDFQKCVNDYFEVGDKMHLCFYKGNTGRIDFDTKVGAKMQYIS